MKTILFGDPDDVIVVRAGIHHQPEQRSESQSNGTDLHQAD